MIRRARLAFIKVWLLGAVILVVHAAVGISQLSKGRACDPTITYNQTVNWQYQVPGIVPPKVIQFPFYFGTSLTYSPAQLFGTGVYPWANITSTGGGALLSNIQVPFACYYTGLVNGSDTTWLPQYTSGRLTGDLSLLYNADDSQQYCNGIPVDDASGCVDDGEGGGGATYGDGTGTVDDGGYVVCRWTDYYDDDWHYLYTEDQGCTAT